MTENQLKYLAYQETMRHNLAGEAIDQGTLDERVRSNLAQEKEMRRSNRAQEELTDERQETQEKQGRWKLGLDTIGTLSKVYGDIQARKSKAAVDVLSILLPFV